MQPTDRQAFSDTLAAMAETYGKSLSGAAMLAYWMALQDLGLKEIQHSMVALMRTSKFFPTIAEIRESAGVVRPCDMALVAWQEVSRAANVVGSYKSISFADPIINAVIRSMGGWPALLIRSVEDFDKWARKEFVQAYESYYRMGVSAENAKPLTGLSGGGDLPSGIEYKPVCIAWDCPTAEIATTRIKRLAAAPERDAMHAITSLAGRLTMFKQAETHEASEYGNLQNGNQEYQS